MTPQTAACQASLSMGFPRQEYWSELPFPSPGDLPNPGTEHPSSPLAGRLFTTEPPGKPCKLFVNYYQMLHISIWPYIMGNILLRNWGSWFMVRLKYVYMWMFTWLRVLHFWTKNLFFSSPCYYSLLFITRTINNSNEVLIIAWS